MIARTSWLRPLAPARAVLDPVGVPLLNARRGLRSASAWAAILAVAGISYAARRRSGAGR